MNGNGETRRHGGREADLSLRFVVADPGDHRFATDARFLLSVRNEAGYRVMSLANRVIPWQEHLEWYRRATASPAQQLYIVSLGREQIGVARLDECGDNAASAEISIALLPQWRGRGLGPLLIGAVCREARRMGYTAVEARVKRHNTPSLRAFEKSGFISAGQTRAGADTLCLLKWTSNRERRTVGHDDIPGPVNAPLEPERL